MYYAGIGSRKTPKDILDYMTYLAGALELLGYTLRSGGANGADSAFEAGVRNPDNKHIFLPWQGFNNNTSPLFEISSEAYSLAKKYHPAWKYLNSAGRKFHARNCYQVLGGALCYPAEFILCWTPSAAITGGTGQALRIAKDCDIPVFNMGSRVWENELTEFLEDLHLEEYKS